MPRPRPPWPSYPPAYDHAHILKMARQLVADAVRRGHVTKPEHCQATTCGAKTRVVAFLPDPASFVADPRPERIVWICYRCRYQRACLDAGVPVPTGPRLRPAPPPTTPRPQRPARRCHAVTRKGTPCPWSAKYTSRSGWPCCGYHREC